VPKVTNKPVYFLARFTSVNHILQLQTHRFLLKFTGNEEEINLLGDGSEKPEFGKWSWMSPEQIIDLVGSFRCLNVSYLFRSVKFSILILLLIGSLLPSFSCRLWISRNLYTRKFWQFLLPIFNKFMYKYHLCVSYTWCNT
jgi:hypothetical protein